MPDYPPFTDVDAYGDTPVDGLLYANRNGVVGVLDRDEYPDVEWVTAVKTPYLQRWADLVRYCYTDTDYPCVDIGVIPVENGPPLPMLVAGRADQQRAVTVSPNLHTWHEREEWP